MKRTRTPSMNRAKELAVAKTLEAVTTKDEGGYLVFNEGWDDERVGKEHGVPGDQVMRYRSEVIGRLRRRGGGAGGYHGLFERFEKLETAHAGLQASYATLQSSHTALQNLVTELETKLHKLGTRESLLV